MLGIIPTVNNNYIGYAGRCTKAELGPVITTAATVIVTLQEACAIAVPNSQYRVISGTGATEIDFIRTGYIWGPGETDIISLVVTIITNWIIARIVVGSTVVVSGECT
jgi:hypothetical protein